jgi:hypothetical protein
LSALVIYTIFEVCIEFLATAMSGESSVWTFATFILCAEGAIRIVIVTRSCLVSGDIVVFAFATLIEGAVRFLRIEVVAIRGISTRGRAIRTTGINALVIDADLTRRTMIIGHTIPRLALVLITDLIVTVRSLGCCIVRTPALWTAGIFDTTIAIATGGLSYPLGTSGTTDLDFVAIGTTAQGSGSADTRGTSVVEAVLAGRTGVEVIPSIAIGIADLDSCTRTAAGSGRADTSTALTVSTVLAGGTGIEIYPTLAILTTGLNRIARAAFLSGRTDTSETIAVCAVLS